MASPRSTTSLPTGRPQATSCVEFSAPDVQETARLRTTVTDLWWIGLSRQGLTYEGTCKNPTCIAWTEGTNSWPGRTACKMSLGSYRPNEDYDYNRVKCPACGFDFIPERYVFAMCKVQVHYRQAGSQFRVASFSVQREGELHVLGTPGRKVVYTSLVINVQPVDQGFGSETALGSSAAASAAQTADVASSQFMSF
eukprot:TRINITY_DN13692_c0_g2_i1.p1 TRINITY_DN13692_c0_g2~~TRINITY_DN13692_c0_g2_i1.p1  ORF type:complete len:196 (+),score=7.82 TRINITY_DN13692_c0_g2_i1:233-820(+)